MWRNRIVRYGEAAPGELLASEKNWRTHPKAQHEVLAGALRKLGIVQNVVVNERRGKSDRWSPSRGKWFPWRTGRREKRRAESLNRLQSLMIIARC
jgi:hypothetical protein